MVRAGVPNMPTAEPQRRRSYVFRARIRDDASSTWPVIRFEDGVLELIDTSAYLPLSSQSRGLSTSAGVRIAKR